MIDEMAHLLVLAALVTACTKAEPTPAPAPPLAPAPAIAPRPVAPPPAPAPPSPPSQRRNTILRTKLAAGGMQPIHGLVLGFSGVGGHSRLTLDLATATLRRDRQFAGESKTQQRKVSPYESSQLMALAEAAWREIPAGKPEFITDSREDLYILDGDEAFHVIGNPLEDLGHTNRPAAAALVKRLSEIRY